MSSSWSAIIQAVAPTLATALGGPLAGIATAAAGRILFGRSDGETTTAQEIATAVATANSPDLLVKLREIEAELQKHERELSFRFAELNADDTKDARQREIALRDPLPGRIGLATIGLYYGAMGAVLYGTFAVFTGKVEIPANRVDIAMTASTLIGAIVANLGSQAAKVYEYFYGSSAGSKDKNNTISDAMARLSTSIPPAPASPTPNVRREESRG